MCADNIIVMAPIPGALKTLIDICYPYSLHNDLSVIGCKSYCVVFKPKLYKLSCLESFMGKWHLNPKIQQQI